MPFTSADAKTHTKKATTPQQQAQWARVANSVRAACIKGGGDETKCDASAVQQANGVIAKGMEEREMPFTDVTEIAHSAIETAITFLVGESDIGEVDVLRLFEALQTDLRNISEAKTKTVDGKARPAGDFLVVGSADEPSTWHLPVKVNGKVDRRLMGAAKAALGPGFRGNAYEGPDKAGATSKLKAMYKAQDMPWSESAQEPLTFEQQPAIIAFDRMLEALDALEETIRPPARPRIPNTVHAAYAGEWKLGDRTTIIHEGKTYERQIIGFSDDGGFKLGEIDPLGELHADGVAVEVADATEADLSEAGIQAAIETGRRAPVFVDFGVMEPGPGNKRDNRYYPADVVKRDVHVFEGSTIFATDHKNKERNERTKVGKLLQCPTRFLENGTPVGRALIYDPYQAEKVRNRADAGALDTLACSIYGKGRAKKGKVDGKTYSIVEAITDGVYLELVSEAGAGGKALNLAESNQKGGNEMSDNEVKTAPAPTDDKIEEVDIQEDKGEAEPEAETPQPLLESAAVETALAETKLPRAFKVALSKGDYADEDALKEAITTAIAEVKRLTGSGQVQDLGETTPPQPEQLTVEELAERADKRYENTKRRFGM